MGTPVVSSPGDRVEIEFGGTPLAKARTCVLVVDDSEEVGLLASEMINELGYNTVRANSAKQALGWLNEQRLRFDLVFTDVLMPGMNGLEFASLVRRQFPGLPVILTSGYSDVLAEVGHNGLPLVHKPYSIEELDQALAGELRKAYQNRMSN